eukprot:CAMPEP_0172675494 /NCGR_PEP_ID=MMETSP1074-20121228/13285_1 /TAXON_ID=2916 /ORGANISM="Ceratium fusus, Strain PA161109" /LENGTH=629 /DNA_ID=CAMNT_0013492949 /DNA_START=81 /DNA_END=1970 /DNA_ORIENTATION=-
MLAARLSSAMVAISTSVIAFPSLRFEVPNGQRVPCPKGASGCEKTDGNCWGLGHATCHGGTFPLNQFGLDLKKAKHKWTKELCEKDSDGDGLSNGEELGDPCCVWGAYDIPSDYTESFKASHPGVASEKQTGYARPQCSATTPKVKAPVMGGFNPGETQHVVDVCINNYTIPMPGNVGPRTQYTSFAWNFPDDSEHMFHVVRAEAIVKTPKNLHHYIVTGCEEKWPDSQHGKVISGRMECNRGFGGWAPGKPIVEMPLWGGKAIGKGAGIVAFSVSVHFDNPDLEQGIVSNDGMRIWYTTTLRKVSPSGLATMQVSINPAMLIPARNNRYYMTRKCQVTIKEKSTQKHVEAQLLLASSHAHLLGTEAYAERIRDGERTPLVNDKVWYFDDQYAHILYPRNLTLRTGDWLVSTCVFNSQGRAKLTVVGRETTDEMCWSTYEFAEGGLTTACKGDIWMGSLNPTEPGLGLELRHPASKADSVFDAANVKTGGSLTYRSAESEKMLSEYLSTQPCTDHDMVRMYCSVLLAQISNADGCDKTYKELGMRGLAGRIGDYTPMQMCCGTACNGTCSANKRCPKKTTKAPMSLPKMTTPPASTGAGGSASDAANHSRHQRLSALACLLILQAIGGS